jgi:hypothetical protein
MSADPHFSDKSLEWWRGNVDARLTAMSASQDAVSEKITVATEKIEELRLTVTKLVVQIGFASVFGSAVIAVVVGIAIKFFAG